MADSPPNWGLCDVEETGRQEQERLFGSRRRGTSGVTSGGSMLSRTRKRWRGFGRPSPPRAGIGCWGLVLAVRSMRTNDLTDKLPRSDAGALPSELVR